MNNTALWQRVQATDPKYTKQFTRGGGFKGTATNATYLAMKATEVFGPIGTGWGITVLDEQVFQGAPVVAEGAVIGHEQIHRVHARLWYVLDGQKGEVEQFGQTQFVGRNSKGWFTDEEAPKKSLTDAMSKCLSLLGFGADIHLGLYDDNKYVSDLKQQFAAKEKEGQPSITEEQAATIGDWIEDVQADRAGFLSYFGIDAIPSLPASRYDEAMGLLQAKKRRAA